MAQEAFQREVSGICNVAIHRGQGESLCPSQSRYGGVLSHKLAIGMKGDGSVRTFWRKCGSGHLFTVAFDGRLIVSWIFDIPIKTCVAEGNEIGLKSLRCFSGTGRFEG
jgi:hypothetical protein